MGKRGSLKDALLKKNEELNGSLSLLGMSMLGNVAYENSMRSVMYNNHLKQFVNLTNPDFPKVFTNGENVVGKYSSGYKKVKHDSTVYKKIVKFEDIIDNPYYYYLFLYDEKKDKYRVLERKPIENLTEVYSYEYNNEEIDKYEEGDFISKGTILTKSTSYDESMNYGFGKNVKVMTCLNPFTSEDACEISESLHKELESTESETITVGINDNDYMLNLYGKNDEYHVIPEIGEYTDGVLCAKKTLYNNQILSDFKDKNLSEINWTSDKIYYGKGTVVDIMIYCNNRDIEHNVFNNQLLKYLDSQTKFYQEVFDTCEEIINSGSKYSHDIEYLYRRSKEILDNELDWREGDSSFSNIRMDITVSRKVPANIGQKITGRAGNKSVIAKITPDEEMPFLEDGTRVDLKINLLAFVNRTIAQPLHEICINFVTESMMKYFKNNNIKTKEKEKIFFDVLNILNTKECKQMKSIYNNLDKDGKQHFFDDCETYGVNVHLPPLWEDKPIFYKFIELYNKYGDVFLQPQDVFVNRFGRVIKVLNQHYIADLYIIKLKQTSKKGFSARNTGSINPKGLPERSYKVKTHQELSSEKPIRFGEYETLNFSIGILPEDIALFHALYRTSIKGRRDLAKTLLKNPDTDELELDDSYDSRVAEIFEVINKYLGYEIEFYDDDEVLREYDKDMICQFDLGDRTYLCTAWEFFNIRRHEEIKQEILDECGILDNDELEKRIQEKIDNENYVMK